MDRFAFRAFFYPKAQKYIPVRASAEIIFECAELNLQMTN